MAPGSPRGVPLPALPPHPATSGPPVDWTGMRRVLAVRLDNLGDVVQTTPALRALAHAAPEAQLDLLASPAGASLAPLLPHVTQVHTVRAAWQDAGGGPVDLDADAALVELLRPYDAVLAFTSFSQSPWPVGYAAARAGVPVRVGTSREFGGALLTHWVHPRDDDQTAHQVDRMLHQLAAVGVAAAGTDLELRVPAGTTAAAGGGALLAPGASAPSRRWAPEGFATVARELLAAGVPVLVAGTARERELVEAVVAGARGAVAAAGTLDVPQLAAAVQAARVVVANNSGTMHLAAALGTPVVAAFAGTETPGQYAPRGVDHRLFRVPTACSPCRAFTCPYAEPAAGVGQPCLDLDPGAVAAAALELAGIGAVAASGS